MPRVKYLAVVSRSICFISPECMVIMYSGVLCDSLYVSVTYMEVYGVLYTSDTGHRVRAVREIHSYPHKLDTHVPMEIIALTSSTLNPKIPAISSTGKSGDISRYLKQQQTGQLFLLSTEPTTLTC